MDKIKNISSSVTQFASDIENEARRITWPSRQEAVKSTLAVVAISSIFAAFLGLVDYLFSLAVRVLLG